jgi:hypothetical protein
MGRIRSKHGRRNTFMLLVGKPKGKKINWNT